MVKVTGFKELNNRLNRISKGAQELGAQKNKCPLMSSSQIPLFEKHTPSENISDFLDGVGVKSKRRLCGPSPGGLRELCSFYDEIFNVS
ncbi:hypothetical protein ACFTAO_15090 [Paenibacillus rhizoplanae]